MPPKYSARDSPVDCSGTIHALDTNTDFDIHWDKNEGWTTCDIQPGPNRYHVTLGDNYENPRYQPIQQPIVPTRIGRSLNPITQTTTPIVESTPPDTELQITTIDTTELLEPDAEEDTEETESVQAEDITSETGNSEIQIDSPTNTAPNTMAQQPTMQDVINLIRQLAQNQANLQTVVSGFVGNMTSGKKFGKPHEYDGT